MRFKLVLGFAIGVVVFSLSAWSHHAHGNYAEKTMDMEGVVTELHVINPHSWIYIEVTKADGQKQLWALEGGGASDEKRAHIKKGDKIKTRCHPLRDGSPACLLGFVKSPDGTVKDWDAAASKDLPKDF